MEGHTMTRTKRTALSETAKELVAGDRDLMTGLMKEALQEVLEAEMSQLLGAGPSERDFEHQQELGCSVGAVCMALSLWCPTITLG
jgi:transposase-like protein